jgi:hypothetical protein
MKTDDQQDRVSICCTELRYNSASTLRLFSTYIMVKDWMIGSAHDLVTLCQKILILSIKFKYLLVHLKSEVKI